MKQAVTIGLKPSVDRIVVLVALAVFLVASEASAGELQRYQFSQPHMGTLYRIVVYAPNEEAAKTAAGAAVA